MTAFFVGDIVRVEMPRGYSMRGVLGISLLFSTSAEAKFEGAIGTITEFNPTGPQSVHQYLVDFRTHDNSRVGIPWQAQWFREEWLAMVERPQPATVGAGAAASTATATWPTRAEETAAGTARTATTAPATGLAGGASELGGIAHPEAKLFTEGRRDFAPGGTVSSEAIGQNIPFTTPEQIDDRSAADINTFNVTDDLNQGRTGATDTDLIVERGEGYVKVRNMAACPDSYPIKGNTSSGVYLSPADRSYDNSSAEICFATEDIAREHGYRPSSGPN